MQYRSFPVFIPGVVFLSLLASMAAAPVQIVGTLQDVNGFPLPGKITVIQEEPHLSFTTHEVEEDGLFQFMSDSTGALLLHAATIGHPSAERVITAGTIGVVTVNFTLPLGQDVEVRVVDAEGSAVSGAELRVRYDEPDKPTRRVSFEREERTDGDGRLVFQDVGIQVPFVVDVLAPNYPPASSKLTKLDEGDTQMDDIVLGAPGATVIVELLDDKGIAPVPDTWVTLLADPAGLAAEERDSWLHYRHFRQRAVTSALGNARFIGVPPGRILVRVKTETGSSQEWGDAVSNQELRVTLWMP